MLNDDVCVATFVDDLSTIAGYTPAIASVGQDDDEPTAFVRAYLAEMGIVLGYDGSPRPRHGRPGGTGPEDALACLSYMPVSLESLLGDLVLAAHDADLKLGTGLLKLALRKLQREARLERRQAVMLPLMRSLSPNEHRTADRMWRDLVRVTFDMPPELAIALLQHFIHQVKSKQCGHPIEHHMMPVIVSLHQDAGKTTFVRRLVGPLQDLVGGAALLSDLCDKRSGEILSHPVVVIDDCEQITGRQVAILKALLTAEHVSRRRLGTSLSETISQDATAIATANQGVDELIRDPSGHRRFAQMPFAIDPSSPEHVAAWEVINATDFALLWRSVDVYAPSPILPHLSALREHQAQARGLCEVEEWLAGLRPGEPKYAMIRTPTGLRARGLYEIFRGKTGSTLTMTAWGLRMGQLTRQSRMPLGPKHQIATGTVYPIRAA